MPDSKGPVWRVLPNARGELVRWIGEYLIVSPHPFSEDEVQRGGGYHLLAVYPDGTTSIDGPHSSPAGVAHARRLFEGLDCIRRPGARYAMLRVSPVPDDDSLPVDQESIDLLNAAHAHARSEESP